MNPFSALQIIRDLLLKICIIYNTPYGFAYIDKTVDSDRFDLSLVVKVCMNKRFFKISRCLKPYARVL